MRDRELQTVHVAACPPHTQGSARCLPAPHARTRTLAARLTQGRARWLPVSRKDAHDARPPHTRGRARCLPASHARTPTLAARLTREDVHAACPPHTQGVARCTHASHARTRICTPASHARTRICTPASHARMRSCTPTSHARTRTPLARLTRKDAQLHARLTRKDAMAACPPRTREGARRLPISHARRRTIQTLSGGTGNGHSPATATREAELTATDVPPRRNER
jgi:hypothetical protein